MKKKRSRRSRRRRAKRILLVILLIIVAILAFACAGLVYLGSTIQNSNRTLPGLYADDIYIGEMTYEEVVKTLSENNWDDRVGGTLKVELPKGVSFEVDYIDSGASVSLEEVAEAAMENKYSGNWLETVRTYLNGKNQKKDVILQENNIDRAYIEKYAKEAVTEFNKLTAGERYTIDYENECITVVKGAGEVSIGLEELTNQVIDALMNKQESCTYTTMSGNAQKPDFKAIYEEIYAEVSDAYYDVPNDKIVEDVTGITFNVSDADALWEKAGNLEIIKVPLVITKPEVTFEELNSTLFCDLLGEQTTYYEGSTDNRINNIQLASSFINGTVMMPGDVFSYNGTVGQRTEDAGFKYAGAYADGQVVQEVGGGICQVSSTLYAATLRANLETVSRMCHQFLVTYLPYGIDATVSWPKPDFQFANNTDYPIRILVSTNYEERSITVQIWGTNVTGNYCEPKTRWWTRNDEVYTDTVIGWGAVCERYIYDKDGNLLDKVWESSSIYDMHSDEINWPPEYYEQDKAPESSEVIIPETTPAPQNPPSETPQDPPSETPQDPPSEAPQDQPSETPQDQPSETPQDPPAETTQDPAPEAQQDTSSETSAE